MTSDSFFMRMALAQAMEAQASGEVPVGAVVVKDGQVIGLGRNAPIGLADPSAHAEIVAMRAAAQALGNYRLDGCELYVTLEPCSMCAGAMLHARIQRMVYGAKDPKTGAAGSAIDLFANTQINHHTHVVAGVLADECSAVLQSFFSARRQELALKAQPLRDDALRTALSAFSSLADYPFVARFFSADAALHGWRMHYLDEGPANSGSAVLCLHDVPGWSYRYRQLIPALSAQGIRVVAPDLIGFGKSDKPKKDAVHTLELHLDSLQRLVEHLHLSNLLLIGVGAGVHLAQLLARQLSTPIHQVVQVLPEVSTAADKLPFPDRGYQAGLRAVPMLVAQLEQTTATLQSSGQGHKVEVLDGMPDVVAERLAAMFLNR